MKVLIDTNVVFDVYEHRQPHYSASNQILKMAQRGGLAAAIAAHTAANGFYVYGKPFVPFLRDRLLEDLEVCAGDAFQTRMALGLGMSDLEDALQAAAAVAWKASFIVSRNVKHFRLSPVPALTPANFLHRFFKKH